MRFKKIREFFLGPDLAGLWLAGSIWAVSAAVGPLAAAGQVDQAGPGELLQELDVLSSFGIEPVAYLGESPALEDYLGYAAAQNEELQAALQGWQSVKDRRPRATALPDPRLRFTEYLEPVQTRVGPQERAFGIAQTIPWFGKLSLQGRIVDERALAAAAEARTVFSSVAYRVKAAYYNLAHLRQVLEITDEHLALLSSWEEAARSEYAAGSGSYANLIKSQVELGKLAVRRDALQDEFRPLAAALNAVLNRAPGAHVPWPGRLDPQAYALDEEALRRRYVLENPELRGLESRMRSFRQEQELAGKQRYPDLTLGLDYIQTGDAPLADMAGGGKDPLLASLAIKIPIWGGKYEAAEREAASSYLAARAARQEKINNLSAALERALFGHRDALRKLELYRDSLLPLGRRSLGAVRAAYETGEADFLDLVDAERLLLELQLTQARAATDLMIGLAEIEMMVGGPVTGAPADAGQPLPTLNASEDEK